MKRDFVQWFMLAGLLVLCFAAAAIGARLTSVGLPEWYATLEKPSWTPPNQAFPAVWTLLYILMALAAWLVWRRRGVRGAWLPLGLWLLQLALNVAWSGAFFALQSPRAGLVVVFLLWWAILATALSFGSVSRVAGGLLVPYLLWVTYAAGLNFAIWRMNA